MASLNVCLQVSFLGECILTERANEWPLPGVLLHVDLKSVLLVERLPTDKAGERPFPSVHSQVPHKLARLAELLLTVAALISFLLRRSFLRGIVLFLSLAGRHLPLRTVASRHQQFFVLSKERQNYFEIC